jgi:hypothetical protein
LRLRGRLAAFLALCAAAAEEDVPAVPAEDRVVVDVLDDVELLDRGRLVLPGPPSAAALLLAGVRRRLGHDVLPTARLAVV